MANAPRSIEGLARIRSAIEKTGDRGAVLRGEGLSTGEWIALQRHWLGALAKEIAEGRHDLSTRYLTTFLSVSDLPVEVTPAPPATPAPPVTHAVPSYLLTPVKASPLAAPIAPPPPHPPTDFGSETVIAPAVAAGPALPFVDGVAIPPKRDPLLPRAERPFNGDSTVPFERASTADAAAPLPFEPAPRQELRAEEVDLSRFPLETLAAITRALARGEDRSSVLAKHRLTPRLFETLSAAWDARMNTEPALRKRFAELAREGEGTSRG